jgi:uncharacterized protein YcbX
MPTVARLNIAPVRSLGLESRDEIELTEFGVAEDRRFYLIDDGGRLVDQLTAGEMVQIGARTDPDATVLRLTFPDGSVVADTIALGEGVETHVYGRTAVGHVVEGPWAEPLGAFIGRSVRIVRSDQVGGTRSKHPATLVSDGSLGALGAALGVGAVDARRFRMLIELDGGGPHEEDSWVGGRIALGGTILTISAPVPRCAMTTHDPITGERDLDTLRGIMVYHGQVDGKHLMFGVWGEVETPGVIRLGDEVRVLS